MTALTRPHAEPSSQQSAPTTVLARNRLQLEIIQDGERVSARTAFSCLVQPEPGDVVATQLAGGEIWVTAILERAGNAPMRLLAPGDLSIVSGGRISLDAGEAFTVNAPALDLQAVAARFLFDDFLHVGRSARFLVTKFHAACEYIEQIAQTMLSRAHSQTRFVEESDQVRAGGIDYRADAALQLTADMTFISATQLVRMDAEQIHMG
jgi:hypothetical protein